MIDRPTRFTGLLRHLRKNLHDLGSCSRRRHPWGVRMTGKRTVLAAAVAAAVALAGFGGIARAAAPTATTGPATAVGSTTAKVTGTVVPGGQSTTWYVEYGTTTSYGSKTASVNAGSGSAAVSITSTLANLKPGATYHYRVVAKNTAGTSNGGDAVFTTLVPPTSSPAPQPASARPQRR